MQLFRKTMKRFLIALFGLNGLAIPFHGIASGQEGFTPYSLGSYPPTSASYSPSKPSPAGESNGFFTSLDHQASAPTLPPEVRTGLDGELPVEQGYPVDPLLEKQLRYIPPVADVEGIIFESQDPAQEAIQICCNERYSNYRHSESSLTFLPGSDNQFGWFSLESQPYIARGQRSGISTAIGFHWLNGPRNIDLPAHLYDFAIGYQIRRSFSHSISFDLSTNVGVYSDFEDSARDGVRFPSHAVGMYRWNKNTDFVMGVDYLSRDDIKILPVFGVSWRNPNRPWWRMDLVFPRPKIEYILGATQKLYVAGLMGGGTWDIEFPDESDDVLTYRDFRLIFGYESSSQNSRSGIEMGYVFDRQIDFRSRPTEAEFDSAFVIRLVRWQ